MRRRSGVAVHSRDIESGNALRLRAGILAGAIALLLFSVAVVGTAQAQTETVIHSFNYEGSDGAYPRAGLIRDSSGNLYGTTLGGGTYGYGTVFKIDSSGNEIVLHSFNSDGSDGINPLAGLIMDRSGSLYGTTTAGGSYGYGTAFKIDSSGNESVLHSFNSDGSDGVTPWAGLIMDASGNLYGTTQAGGSYGYGTVFKIDSSGNESVLHSFNSDGSDGAYPIAGLIMDTSGNLYGTTQAGGPYGIGHDYFGFGTVFKIDSSGNETVLHRFNYYDGAHPEASLIRDSSGNLYGTTFGGGSYGFGTAFKMDSSGNESVLYSFNQDIGLFALNPFVTGLIMDVSGNLYGTTGYGGSYGWGTVFKIDSSGNMSVLHSFKQDGSDGIIPRAGLIPDASGNLYGTTYSGGSYGSGTVFKITLAVPFSAFHAKLEITAGKPPGFELSGAFNEGAGAPAIDPLTQAVTLTVGSYSVTLPAGSLKPTMKGYVYQGTINGVALQLRIMQTGANSYSVQAEASGVDLTTLPNPITVSLTIGQNTGTTDVDAD